MLNAVLRLVPWPLPPPVDEVKEVKSALAGEEEKLISNIPRFQDHTMQGDHLENP